MNTPWRILVAEASTAQFRVLQRHIEKHKLAADLHHVVSLADLVTAMQTGGWDLVLSDDLATAPEFEQALRLVQAQLEELPLILLTTASDDHRAVDLLRQGVWDFVQKGSLSHLVPVMQRCRIDADHRRARRKAESAWRESERQKVALLNSLESHTAVIDRQGLIVAANARWERFAAERSVTANAPLRRGTVGDNYLELCRDDRAESQPEARRAHDGILAVLEGRSSRFSLEYRCDTSAGPGWFLLTATPLDPEVHGAIVSHLDITERREAEERSRIKHDLMQALAAATQLEEGLRLCVDAAIKAAGLDSGGFYLWEDASGALTLCVHQGHSPEFVCAVSRFEPGSAQAEFVAAGKPMYGDMEKLHPALSEAERREGLRATGLVPLAHEGRPIGCLNVASHTRTEISPAGCMALETIAAGATQAIVRLRATQALRESEERHRGIFDESVAAIYVFDPHKRFIGSNQAGLALLGYSHEELLRLSIPDVDADPAAVLPAHQQLLSGGRLVNYEHRLRRKDGTIITVLNNSRPLTDAGGNVVGMQSTLFDITEPKRSEKLQLLSGEVFRILNDPRAQSDATQRILTAIKRATEVEAVGIRLHQGNDYPYAVSDGFSDSFLKAENHLTARTSEGGFCLDEQGNIRLECTCGLVLSGQTDPAHPMFTPGGSAWTNDARLAPEAPADHDRRFHPRDRCLHEGYQSVALVPIRVDDGVIGLLHLSDHRKGCFTAEMIRYLEGLASSFGVTLQRLREEQQVRESQRTLRCLFDSVPESLSMMSLDGEVLAANLGFAARFGKNVEECVGNNLLRLVPQPLVETRRSWIAEVRRSGEPVVNEERWGERWLRHHYCPVFSPDGRVESIVALAVNITQLKQAEAALAAEAARRRILIEGSRDGIVVLDSQGKVFEANRRFAEMLGYSPDELQGLHVWDWDRSRPRDRLLEDIRHIGPEGEHYEARHARKDGSVFDVELSNSGAELAGLRLVFCVCRDITERKRWETALRESEDRYRLLVEESPDAIGIFQDNQLVFINSTGVRRLGGTSKHDLLGKRSEEIIHPEDLAVASERIRHRLAGDTTVYPAEVRYLRLDGTVMFIEVSAGPVQFNGKLAMQFIARDISERKRAEAMLRESLWFRREAEKIARIGAWKVSPETDYLYWTEGVYEIIGLPLDYKPGLKDGLSYYDAESLPLLQTALAAALKDGTPFTVEIGLTTPTGRKLWTEVRGLGRVEEGGQAYVMGTFQDITARQQRERFDRLSLYALQRLASGALLSQVLESLISLLESGREDWLGSIMLADESEAHLSCVAGARLPVSFRRAIAETPIAVGAGSCGTAAATRQCLIAEDIGSHPAWSDYAEAAIQAGLRACWSLPILSAEGRVLGALAVYHTRPCAPTGEELASIQGVVELASIAIGKRRSEEALREREEVFSSIVGQAMDAIALYDAQTGRFVEFNQAAHEGLGYTREEFATFTIANIQAEHSPSVLARHLERLRQQGGLRFETRHRHRDGSLRDVRVSLKLLRIRQREFLAAVWTDITERRQLEAQFRQAQKLEAVGHLAGGVAHDFNNILAAILMQIELLRADPNLSPDGRESLKELEVEARRAAALTRQLLMFSRRSVMDVRVLNLNELVENLLKMLRRLIGERVELQFVPETNLPAIRADSGMLEQVLMNLTVNARDAMPKGGRILIRSSQVTFDEAESQKNPERRAGRFVALSVADTGCGMDSATLRQIFEPFFTTKEAGKGTGLGLATVHGIVGQHSGWIEVESEVGHGTVFRVMLPTVEGRPETTAHEPFVPPTALRGNETVLLVEDENAVRRGLAQFLRILGYRVLEATDGHQAIGIWETEKGSVDLLLTDMVMPGEITGLELSERLQQEKPGLKVIISSGYSSEMAHHGHPTAPNVSYLPKPYDAKTLGNAIRASLSSAPPEG